MRGQGSGCGVRLMVNGWCRVNWGFVVVGGGQVNIWGSKGDIVMFVWARHGAVDVAFMVCVAK